MYIMYISTYSITWATFFLLNNLVDQCIRHTKTYSTRAMAEHSYYWDKCQLDRTARKEKYLKQNTQVDRDAHTGM